jgi:hypothetical protein
MLSIIRLFMSAPHARAAKSTTWPAEERGALLESTCTAVRLGFFDEALAMLDGDEHAAKDPACLNLLGVIHELRQDWKAAHRHYRRSIRSDRTYAPARQNVRRLYELETLGRSAEGIALGDERPALARLLQMRQPIGDCADASILQRLVRP